MVIQKQQLLLQIFYFQWTEPDKLTIVSVVMDEHAWLCMIMDPNEKFGLTLSPLECSTVARSWLGGDVFNKDSKYPLR